MREGELELGARELLPTYENARPVRKFERAVRSVQILERPERDPGLEAAAYDLYGGAASIVESGTPPTHRQQRLLREASQRFEERLKTRWKELATRTPS